MFVYSTFSSRSAHLSKALNEILCTTTQRHKKVVRIIFFSNIDNNQYYEELYKMINACIKLHFIGSYCPVFSLVAQSPKLATLSAEVTYLDNPKEKTIKYKTLDQVAYITIETANAKFLFTQGIFNDIYAGVKQQSENIFYVIRKILLQENILLCNIIRQWNYMENIIGYESVSQRYQLFNNARSRFYANTRWIYGYPSATGIGTQTGGVMVEIDAVISLNNHPIEIIPINNTRQIAAHDYSKNVLVGETTGINTPKFERAKYLSNEQCEMIFISGTASIRGEKTVYLNDVKLQTETTIGNIIHLLSQETFKLYGINTKKKPKISLLRIYVKHSEDFEVVQQVVEKLLPSIPTLYVKSDICRPELLVEMEAIANFVVAK